MIKPAYLGIPLTGTQQPSFSRNLPLLFFSQSKIFYADSFAHSVRDRLVACWTRRRSIYLLACLLRRSTNGKSLYCSTFTRLSFPSLTRSIVYLVKLVSGRLLHRSLNHSLVRSVWSLIRLTGRCVVRCSFVSSSLRLLNPLYSL